ncbi:MAG: Zn-ribbon containing protein [Candidatus Nanoarchaeia archaeon]|nr:Zn-ribbon containing protein [Candidatus Nanoarchaeia archaeon]
MSHQCVHCGEIYPAGSKALLEGCSKCKGHFFFYLREDQIQRIKDNPIEIPKEDRVRIEKDIREIAGIMEEDAPVILDIESIRVTGGGKFEIDLIKLFSKERPLVYKLEEGKYIIDIASTLRQSMAKKEDKE